MGFQVDNNNYSRFYESNNCRFHNQPNPNQNNVRISNDFLSQFFDFLSKAFASNNNPSADFVRQLFQGMNQPPVTEDYGGFKFRNEAEKSKIDQAIEELRAEQAANPGKAVSKKFKIGKYKYKVTLDENGQLDIKRKKKKKGLFGKIGDAFKKIGKGIGGFLKKALPIVSTVAMFIPGLQPFALAARIGTGIMGVVDGIKNGNFFGAIMSGVGALSGVGGKVGSFFSNLSSKATGFLGNLGSNFLSRLGNTGTWLNNAIGRGTELFGSARNWFSNWTSGIGTRVSNFFFTNGSKFLGNLTNTFGGKFGQWLTERGPGLLRNFADSMGRRATNWLADRANNFLARLMDNPIARRVNSFLNSPFAQILISMFQRSGRA